MRLDVVLRVTTKFILAPLLLFALYVQFHGDYGPGGGFQAGVIAAAAIAVGVLFVFGVVRTVRRIMKSRRGDVAGETTDTDG